MNPFMPTGAINICCPRDCVSRHNGGTSGAPLKPLRVDSALSLIVLNDSASRKMVMKMYLHFFQLSEVLEPFECQRGNPCNLF